MKSASTANSSAPDRPSEVRVSEARGPRRTGAPGRTGGAPRGTHTRQIQGMELYGLLLTAFSILLLLSLISFDPRDVALDHKLRAGDFHNLIGPVGAHIADLLFRIMGLGALLGCSTFFYFGGLLLAGRRPSISGGGLVAYVLSMLFACVVAHLLLASFRPFAHNPGGLVGIWVGEIMRGLFATTGTIIIAGSVLTAGILRLSGMSLRQAATMPQRLFGGLREWMDGRGAPVLDPDTTAAPEDSDSDSDSDKQAAPTRPERRAKKAKRKARVSIGERPSYLGGAPEPTEALQGRSTVPSPSAEAVPPASVERTPAPEVGTKTPERPPKAAPKPAGKASKAPKAPKAPKPATPKTVGDGQRVLIDAPLVDRPMIADMADVVPPPLVADQESLPFDELRPYEPPSLSLLDYEPPVRGAVDHDALQRAAETLEAKLADFGVKGKVVKIQPGPVVTMFEFLPAAGVKISKIQNLSDDLTMALHAQRVRIVAPIPGKGVVGVEVPSAVRETVFLKEILASPEFQEHRGKLPVALGKDIVGHPVTADLSKMPHLLVAGSTGSGKSVAINTFICSLLYRQRPKDLRLILVDPKMLELSVYDDIPHLLLPVVTEPTKASLALKWAVSEMERRYRLLAAFGVRNISGFNQKIDKMKAGGMSAPDGVGVDELEHLPYIVIILDELADLMMVAGKDVEKSIARLAQMARASGLHLIVATQRPSVDVITGLIKANFPTRMSFMVSQKVDSRTILDRMGAENLLGQGDMLYLPPGTSKLTRVQGCFVSDGEVERIVGHLKAFGPPEYHMDILIDEDEESKDLSSEDYDALFDQAVAIVTDTRNPSISYLQRRLKIGYNRSARIIERMEFDGIISRADHRGVRKVLAPSHDDD